RLSTDRTTPIIIEGVENPGIAASPSVIVKVELVVNVSMWLVKVVYRVVVHVVATVAVVFIIVEV
nr:hypothetical protein [Nitrososphaeria archaeon]